MRRIALFLGTNLAVLMVLGVVMNLLQPWLVRQGIDVNMAATLIIALVFGMGGAFISLLMSKRMALMSTRAKVIDSPANETERWLVATVEKQAREAGIGMPDVAIYDAPEPNAFATGASRNNALVAVSTGLLRSMRPNEVEAVLAHEVSHVANGDMITMTLLQGVLNTFVLLLSRILGQLIDRVVFKSDRGHGPGYWISVIVLQLVLGVLASLIVMAFSRWREFRADAGGARLAGRQNMMAALQRLKSAHGPAQLPESVEAFGIRGRVGGGLRRLLMSHPPLDERIEALARGQG
ncbi:protease HtpX [Wenzhouxiangella marina]|uniref:Protease HtpX n=1 Tax=Wenzhouxiangella marina TaxID=1579979 RepID=A0A0K0XWK1_9GAMM|nr:protease HtpX [Wenzhouxiangella marina]AKS42079.1 heat shock protein HtpX [Wenzhouxiangella marina]MBB6086152.1 heat shock protein HtpX [Wenzhouxiangella marina]